jgi:hypothetical protein
LSEQKVWQEGVGDDEFRHRCLARKIIQMRIQDRDKAHVWMYGGMDVNGNHVKGWQQLHKDSILIRDILSQWKLGSRGKWGDWK